MPDFGLFLNAGAQLGGSHKEVFDLTLKQAEMAERLGYRDVWVSEHHFIPFGVNANALTLAGFLLGRTKRLRVGTAVTLAPLYHPMQLAEQVAILDQCSDGRLDFGIGRGGYLRDFEVFGIDIARWDDEIEASAELMLKAWTREEAASDGRWFDFTATPIVPRPLSRPHPPLHLATSTPKGIELAARHRLPLLHYWGTPMEARMKVEAHYTETAEKCGTGGLPAHVHALVVLVTDDEEKARAQLEHALLESFKAGDWPHVPQAKNRHVDADGKPVDRAVLAQFVAKMALVGTPERVSEGLRDMEEKTGASRFVLYMEAIAEKRAILESVERFAGEVIPLLSTKETATA